MKHTKTNTSCLLGNVNTSAYSDVQGVDVAENFFPQLRVTL